MNRFKTFNATGIAPNGRLYAGDLNLFQDLVAALSDFTQNVQVGSLAVGAVGIGITQSGTDEAQVAADLRVTGILTALAGLVYGSFTTTQRNAIVLPPHLLLIYNSTTSQFEYNSGTSAAPVWSSLVPSFGASSVSTSMLQDHAVTKIKLGLQAVGYTEIANDLRPSASAVPSVEALRAIGATGDQVVAGNDARLTDTRTPTDNTVTAAKVHTSLKGGAAAGTEALRALGVTATTAAAGNDSRFGAVGVASTIAGLGTAADGKMGLLRLGTTPFEFELVTYDATYGKWVSAVSVAVASTSGGFNGGNTAYSLASNTHTVDGIPAYSWRIRNAAGLAPQIRLTSVMGTSGGSAQQRPIYARQDEGSSITYVAVTAAAGESSTTDTSAGPTIRKRGAFVAIDAGFTVQDIIIPGGQWKVTGAFIWDTNYYQTDLRWVG